MKAGEVELFGCGINPLTMEDAVAAIDAFVREKALRQAVFLNAGKFFEIYRNPALADAVLRADLRLADGQSVVWACRFLGKPVPERVPGIDLMFRLMEWGTRVGYRFFFLGAREEVVRGAVERCKERYPGIKIVGWRNGYFTVAEEDEVADRIRYSGADVLFVAISSPRKELFIERCLSRMEVPFVMGVGGSFDVVAGVTKRAPVFMQRLGLEWLFRLAQEPRRLWKRYLVGNAWFILKTLRRRFGPRGK